MSRQLHRQDVCTVTDQSVQSELTAAISDGTDTCIVAVEDQRLEPLIPIQGQQTLADTQIPFPAGTILCTAPLHRAEREQESHLPHTSGERFHFETNQFQTVILLVPKCGYFQRPPPFLDATRITKSGGDLIAATGLQPLKPPTHDAKWWIPNSADVDLSTIRVVRSDEFQTPVPISTFTVTADTDHHPEATVVTSPETTTTLP